jgi:hypothetical protein
MSGKFPTRDVRRPNVTFGALHSCPKSEVRSIRPPLPNAGEGGVRRGPSAPQAPSPEPSPRGRGIKRDQSACGYSHRISDSGHQT